MSKYHRRENRKHQIQGLQDERLAQGDEQIFEDIDRPLNVYGQLAFAFEQYVQLELTPENG